MSLDLDDETLESLGYATERTAFDDRLSPTRLGGNPSRIATGDIDGRSKRNWRHRVATALPVTDAVVLHHRQSQPESP